MKEDAMNIQMIDRKKLEEDIRAMQIEEPSDCTNTYLYIEE